MRKTVNGKCLSYHKLKCHSKLKIIHAVVSCEIDAADDKDVYKMLKTLIWRDESEKKTHKLFTDAHEFNDVHNFESQFIKCDYLSPLQ